MRCAPPWIVPACTTRKSSATTCLRDNEVLIDLDVQETSEQALDNGKN